MLIKNDRIISEFETNYVKKTKNRKKCFICNKLIQERERVMVYKIKEEKYYPMKGIMKFVKWKFCHIECRDK